MIRRNWLILAICAGLFSLPWLIYQNHYFLGGDDTRLYYVFPEEFIQNYVFNLSSNNTLAGASSGYNSVAYYYPFLQLISWLKILPVNTQLLLYGLNLIGGFVGFYLCLNLVFKTKFQTDLAIKINASLGYVLSIFLINSYYQNQLLAVYLVSILPIVWWLIVSGISQNNLYKSAIGVLVFSLLSGTMATLPWWAAFGLGNIGVIAYLIWRYPTRALVHGVVIFGLTTLLNIYWWFDLVFGYFQGKGLLQSYAAVDFVTDNLRIMRGVGMMYSPLNILFYTVDRAQQFNLLLIVNVSLMAIVIGAGIFLARVKHELWGWYSVAVVGLLLSWYFYSPNIGSWGLDRFVWMGQHLPFFTMFRNMYDKFALVLAFYLALSLGVSLKVVLDRVKSEIFVRCLVILVVGVVLVNAYWTYTRVSTFHQQSSLLSGKFNNDFNQLINYLNQQSDYGGVLWWPLNSPTYVNVADGVLESRFYSGLSPMRVLVNRNDYTGRFSFISQQDIFEGDKLFKAIAENDADTYRQIIQSKAIKYVVVDHQQLPEEISQFMYGGIDKPVLKVQTKQFMDQILGLKLVDFGRRYSLYLLNPELSRDLVYLNDGSTQLQFSRLNNEAYQVDIPATQSGQLVLNLPYNPGWQIADRKIVASQSAFGANQWVIDSSMTKRSINLVFEPSRYQIFTRLISLVTGLFLVMILIWRYGKSAISKLF